MTVLRVARREVPGSTRDDEEEESRGVLRVPSPGKGPCWTLVEPPCDDKSTSNFIGSWWDEEDRSVLVAASRDDWSRSFLGGVSELGWDGGFACFFEGDALLDLTMLNERRRTVCIF